MPGSGSHAKPSPAAGPHQPAPRCLVIQGITRDGRRFRPSDWAQRLAMAAAACDRDRDGHFHPLVRVMIIDGIAAIIIDGALARSDPPLYRFLGRFGHDNHLRVSEY